MSDAFRPVSAGDRIKPRINAEWMNGVNRAVNTLRGGDIDLAQAQLPRASSDATTATVVNKSGSDIDHRGGVLKLDGLYFSFADRPTQVYGEPELKGISPSDANDRFVITTTPIKNNKPGKCKHTGLTFCRLNFTDASHDHAQPSDTTDYLVSGTTGVPIICRELEETGEQWAVVLLGGGGGGGGGSVITWVLIEDDIGDDQIAELDDPAVFLLPEDVPLTDDEIAAGVTVILQDPASATITENNVEQLELLAFEQKTIDLKYFKSPAVDTPGYEDDGGDPPSPLRKFVLATIATDDPGSETEGDESKIVRYDTKPIVYGDFDGFTVGQYTKDDYLPSDDPRLAPGEAWPPEGLVYPDGFTAETFFKRRFLGKAEGDVLESIYCGKPFPPRPLPPE